MNPTNPPICHAFIGSAALMKMACSGTDLTPLSERLLELAGADRSASSADALLDLSTILQLSNCREIALSLQTEALKLKQLYHLPAPRGIAGIRLLALMTHGDLMTNTPLDFLMEDSDIALDILYISPHLPFPDHFPDHDVLFVAIGESDETRALLERLGVALEHWPKPMLNRAEHIPCLSRDHAFTRLSKLPDVEMPATTRVSRAELEKIAIGESLLASHLSDAAFPLIVRPVGSHAGRGLEKIDSPDDLLSYLHRIESDKYYLSRFIDYSNADGLFRKYRVVLIDGKPYAAHMGISSHWMIHYMNAGMAESVEKRAEEAQFMAEFDSAFARRHADAIQAIYQAMQLDYLILDCAETRNGELLIFELDNSAVVHTMDPVNLFPYKQPQMRKVFYAFRALLANAVKHSQAE
jgi:glutathione synthase/RimK-type ligase-like ATP-grasp enzyme